jgi:hypothetical protein
VAIGSTGAEVRRIREAAPSGEWGLHLVGTPEQVVRQVTYFTRLGAEHVIVAFIDYPHIAGAALFAEEVKPVFKGERGPQIPGGQL